VLQLGASSYRQSVDGIAGHDVPIVAADGFFMQGRRA